MSRHTRLAAATIAERQGAAQRQQIGRAVQQSLQVGQCVVEVIGGAGLLGFGDPAANGDGAQPEPAFDLGKTNRLTASVVGAVAVEVAVEQSLCGRALNGCLPPFWG